MLDNLLITGIFLNELEQPNHILNGHNRFLNLIFGDEFSHFNLARSQLPLSNIVQHQISVEMVFPLLRGRIEVLFFQS